MLNIRQTSTYASFMRSLNWQVEKIDGTYIFIRKILFFPAIIKIQRPYKLPTLTKLRGLMKKYGARSISVEPTSQLTTNNLQLTTSSDPYIYTKSIEIDLLSSETSLFNRFTSAKRRAVRRAQALGIQVKISDEIEAFIHLKNKTAGFFLGWLTTYGFTKKLWHAFTPQQAKVVLAYQGNNLKPVAGILLLWANKTAYYWMAAATSTGKKKFAPTLCVWEALKFAKMQKCTVFNFEGVYDERLPHRNRDWQGFSNFKGGFGGKPIYYPQPFVVK